MMTHKLFKKVLGNVLTLVGAFAFVALGAGQAAALPTLQLGIGGGTYDPVTETIVTDADTFTVYAYLSFDGTNGNGTPTGRTYADLVGTTYYISTALTPKTSTAGSYGSFDFDGSTVNVTADMTYGTPPIELVEPHPDKDLAPHGIFDTFYTESAFTFDEGDKTDPFNTQDNPGATPSYSGGDYMLFHSFEVDRSLLAEGYGLHFDLYSTVVNTTCKTKHGETVCTDDRQVDLFAPFSHDAGTNRVPEPGTLMMRGAGLLGLAAWERRRRAGA
jgi:hypothetical protein